MDKTKSSIDHREAQRKSLDKIRINNPFNEDIVVRWDRFPHIVPKQGYAIKERYIAEKYLREVSQRILTQRNDKLRNEENKRRTDKGQPKMSRYQDEVMFETDLYANWGQKQLEIIKQYNLYGGVVEEFGMAYLPSDTPTSVDPEKSLIERLEAPETPTQQLTRKSNEELTLAEQESTPQPSTDSLIDNLEGKSQFELRKIAKEKGLTTQKTDKKADLIAAISA